MTLLTSKLGMTINDELLVGHSHHQAGRLENAKTIYESILLKQPHHFDALQLLGMLSQITSVFKAMRSKFSITFPSRPYFLPGLA